MNATAFKKAISDAKLDKGHYTDQQRARLIAARKAFFALPDCDQTLIVKQCVRFGNTVRFHGLGPVGVFEIYVAASQLVAERRDR